MTDLERTYIAVESIDRELRAFEDVFGVPRPRLVRSENACGAYEAMAGNR